MFLVKLGNLKLETSKILTEDSYTESQSAMKKIFTRSFGLYCSVSIQFSVIKTNI